MSEITGCDDCMTNHEVEKPHYCKAIDLRQSLRDSRSYCIRLKNDLDLMKARIAALELALEQIKKGCCDCFDGGRGDRECGKCRDIAIKALSGGSHE